MWFVFFFLYFCFVLFFEAVSHSIVQAGVILAHCNLFLPGSRDSLAPVSRVAGITDACHEAQLIFVFLVETGFHHVGQAGLELLTSSDPLALAFQSAGIMGMSHCAQPVTNFLPRFLKPGFFLCLG